MSPSPLRAHRPLLVAAPLLALAACSSTSAAAPTGDEALAVADDLDTCEAVTLLRDLIVDHLDEPSIPDLPTVARVHEVLAADLGSADLAGRAEHARATVAAVEEVTPAQWGQIGEYDDLFPALLPEPSRDLGWVVEDHVLTGFRTPVFAAEDAAALEERGCDLHGLDGTIAHLQPGWSDEVRAADHDLGPVVGVVGSWLEGDLDVEVLEALCAGVFGDVEHHAGWVPTAAPSATCWAPDPDGVSAQARGAVVEITTGALPFGGATVEPDGSDAGPVLRIAGAMVREATLVDLTAGISLSARVPADGSLTEDELLVRTLEVAAELPQAPMPPVPWPGPDTEVVRVDPADVGTTS